MPKQEEPNYDIALWLAKHLRSKHIEWYMLGFEGTCHNCDSRISAPFKFYNHHTGEIGNGDVNYHLCFPLVCGYCGQEHRDVLLYSKESLAREGEKICLKAH